MGGSRIACDKGWCKKLSPMGLSGCGCVAEEVDVCLDELILEISSEARGPFIASHKRDA